MDIAFCSSLSAERCDHLTARYRLKEVPSALDLCRTFLCAATVYTSQKKSVRSGLSVKLVETLSTIFPFKFLQVRIRFKSKFITQLY